ncbi:branched-chain amino acid transport [Pantoea ananatis]|uniref:AzlD domain-containing protein n=1 Tax=Pantoea ananas TaxID=553 RepID=UPI0007374626|nr:AzlD domain-containing protein [Pantoea ananatis]KTR46936.1 branched-chain amino acid transport [Pantoea ananatis]KTR54449.1 branched-chain amino acid transport [Pantoea ananatis]KTR64045.1 branched-chain amino acid transport [Pantoea ananatis]KTR70262.1 branched-chain amino acid transport [Pantoea ananatis]MDS7722252.1 AzlD domain-containing protein [Pantoea ananatis]
MNHPMIIGGIALLAAGTYAIRYAGVKLGNRLPVSERTQNVLSDAATVLLLAVAATTTLFEGQHFAGMARLLGVSFAIFLAWRRAPLIVIILGAACVTALLRYLNVP